jgi:hypothetical protein
MVEEAVDALDGERSDEHHCARHDGDHGEQRSAEEVLPDVDELVPGVRDSW